MGCRIGFAALVMTCSLLIWGEAFAQIDECSGPGKIIPTNMTDMMSSSVIETGGAGIVEVRLDAMHNGAVKWADDTFFVTNAPSFTYERDIPVGTFGLAAGDTLQTLLTVTLRSGPLNGLGTLDLHTAPVADIAGGGIVPVPRVPMLREVQGLLQAEARRQNGRP